MLCVNERQRRRDLLKEALQNANEAKELLAKAERASASKSVRVQQQQLGSVEQIRLRLASVQEIIDRLLEKIRKV